MSTYCTRTYNLSDSELLQEAKRKLQIVERDMNYFNQNEEVLTAYRATEKAYNAMAVASERVGISMRFMLRVELIAEELRVSMKKLEEIILSDNGISNGLLLKRGEERLSHLSDAKLLGCGISLAKKARFLEEQGALAKASSELLCKLCALCSEYEELLRQKVNKQIERAIADEECTHFGNLLYDRLYFLCNLGKRKFFIADWDRYREYLMPEENISTVNKLIQLNFGHHLGGMSQSANAS